jgi:hypothetical protein
LDFKEDRIKGMPNQQMRYYPKDKQGNLDEWGAMISHQTSVYEREKQEAQ